MDLMSESQVAYCLKRLGNYRVKRVGEVLEELKKPTRITQAIQLALGLRETGLLNIEGGAIYDSRLKKWVKQPNPMLRDVGPFQISRHWHLTALRKMPGVKEGSWGPVVNGKTAGDAGFCPRWEESCDFAAETLVGNENYADDLAVAKTQQVQFAIAAWNAGRGGAKEGWRAGNLDKYTTMGDYSEWVLHHAKIVSQWLADHPNWKP
jgi:hypothetical protein